MPLLLSCRCCNGDFNLTHFPEEIEHRYWVLQHCFLSKTHMGIYCCQKQCYYCSQMGFSRQWPEAVWVMSVMRHHARVTHRSACRHSRENLNTIVWRDVVVQQTSRIHARRRLETSFQDVNEHLQTVLLISLATCVFMSARSICFLAGLRASHSNLINVRHSRWVRSSRRCERMFLDDVSRWLTCSLSYAFSVGFCWCCRLQVVCKLPVMHAFEIFFSCNRHP